jgi:hypothetical protein
MRHWGKHHGRGGSIQVAGVGVSSSHGQGCLRGIVGSDEHRIRSRISRVCELGKAVGASPVVVGAREEEIIRRLPERNKPALGDDWLGGGSGLRLLGLEGSLRLGGLLGLLIGPGRFRRASTALEVLDASLELLAYKRAFMSVWLGISFGILRGQVRWKSASWS